MKITVKITAALLTACFLLSGCGSTSSSETKVSENKNTSDENGYCETTVTVSELPTDTFSELPTDAESDLDFISKIANKLYPDVKGDKMYGYLGTEEITTDNGTCTCRIFEFYTYKSKSEVYTEIATLAKDTDSPSVYIYNAETETYSLAETAEEDDSSAADNAATVLAASTEQ
jgi:hypothetical protein